MLKLIALILPLGLDSFAICAALGLQGLSPAERRRVMILFPVMETSAPLVGLALGAPLGSAIGDAADYLAGVALIALGLFTLMRADEGEADQVRSMVRVRGIGILAIGLTIALDELAIGFTIGLLGLPLAPALALIAIQAVAVSQLGLRLGARLGEARREGLERLAGLALIAIGIFLLVEKVAS